MKKHALLFAFLLLASGISTAASAVALPAGTLLTIDQGFEGANSYFTMVIPTLGTATILITSTRVTDGGRYIKSTDGGILLGTVQPMNPLGNHGGWPASSDRGPIDRPWSFFGNTGQHYTVGNGITDNGDGTLNMTNWRFGWNWIPGTNLGGGLQDCGTTSDGICIVYESHGYDEYTEPIPIDIGGIVNQGTGLGTFTVSGTNYTLNYGATLYYDDPSGFGTVPYGLHLEGRIFPAVVPEPASLLLLGTGLAGIIGLSKRKRR